MVMQQQLGSHIRQAGLARKANLKRKNAGERQ